MREKYYYEIKTHRQSSNIGMHDNTYYQVSIFEMETHRLVSEQGLFGNKQDAYDYAADTLTQSALEVAS